MVEKNGFVDGIPNIENQPRSGRLLFITPIIPPLNFFVHCFEKTVITTCRFCSIPMDAKKNCTLFSRML